MIAAIGLFAAILFLSILIPGPDIITTISLFQRNGWNSVLHFGSGTVLGKLLILTLSLFCQSLILVLINQKMYYVFASAYLVFLGITVLRQQRNTDRDISHSGKRFWQGFILAVNNPQALLFYMAVIPITLKHEYTQQAVMYLSLYICVVVVTMVVFSSYCMVFRCFDKWLCNFTSVVSPVCGIAIILFGCYMIVSTLAPGLWENMPILAADS